MDPEFIRLIPFIFSGIIIGIFLPLGNDPPPGRGMRPPPFTDNQRPPPGVVFDNPNLSPFFGLLVRRMTSILDVFGTVYDLSTTLHSGDAHFPSTPVDTRTRFLSAARMQAWAGLAGVSADSLSMVGTLRGPDGSLTTQDEQYYVRRYIAYALIDTLFCRDDAVLSPGVLNGIARSLAGTRYTPSAPSTTGIFELDEDDIQFILSSTVAIAGLVIALISREENEPEIRAAFRRFAEDPTSWVLFTSSARPGLLPSIEQVVQQCHRRLRGSSRILTVGPHRFPSRGVGTASPLLPSITPASLGGPFISNGGTSVFDIEAGTIEAGTEITMLQDEEIEYFAALFVAALIRFHASGTVSVPDFKRAI